MQHLERFHRNGCGVESQALRLAPEQLLRSRSASKSYRAAVLARRWIRVMPTTQVVVKLPQNLELKFAPLTSNFRLRVSRGC